MMDHIFPKYVTSESIYSLIEKLNLPEPEPFEQDWEYMVANVDRISEFLSFYEQGNLSIDEKFTLMIIIIQSCDDALWDQRFNQEIWGKIKHYLITESHIHRETILYWALLEDNRDLEDCFAITPYIREIVKVVGIQNIDEEEHP